MLPGKKFTPDEILGIALRRKWLIVLPFAVGIIGSQFVARRLPNVYRSETLIQVIPQQIPESIVKSTVTATLEERLPSISEQILSRSRLERTIADFDLYRKERARDVMEDVIARMRADIKGHLNPIAGVVLGATHLGEVPAAAEEIERGALG